jgi:hypothetical protein
MNFSGVKGPICISVVSKVVIISVDDEISTKA